MRTRMRSRFVRPRCVLVLLTLLGHLATAVGFPLPAPRAAPSVPYPCQDRPCGCRTAELCWAGDCCCSTLEQKLAWADANGIDPPPHVRPAVEQRKAARPAKKKSCCAEPAASCCDAKEPTCCEKPAAPEQPAVAFVAGVFAQKCRGDLSAGVDLDAGFAPDPAPCRLAAPVRVGVLPHIQLAAIVRVVAPPAPPPRLV